MLQLESICYAYPDGRKALREVSFALAEGEAVGLVGANGAGKSTLLRLLPGIIAPTSGALYLRGEKLDKRAVARIRREVGLVMQEAEDQLFTPTVFDDVAFGPRNQALPPEEADRRANEALTMVGAENLAQRAPYRLSGGEQRLAAIAAVLAMRPSLLAMDEPSAALDPRARRTLITLLASLPQARLIATHDLDLVWDVCPRVIILREGRIAADGPARALLADVTLLEGCGLELPLRFAGKQ